MARGKEAKLRRRNRKKEDERVGLDIFGDDANAAGNDAQGDHDFGATPDFPMPPSMSGGGGAKVEADDSSSEEEVIIKKKKKKKSKKTGDAGGMNMPPPKKKNEIKRTPLILLILMTGSTLLPALIFASDYIGGFLAKHHVLGQIGFRLGMGGVPRKRVLSFYEKHDPEKIENVPDILSKYYGDYPKMIKRLERKYQDYGYFLGWEEDEAPLVLAMEQLKETYDTWIHSYWNVYAPQTLKTGARNIRYNLTYLHKKIHKFFWKKVWPVIEPIVGVPKGTEKQKRQDAAEARKRKKATSGQSGSGTRRRSAQFRDDDEE